MHVSTIVIKEKFIFYYSYFKNELCKKYKFSY